MTSKCDARRTPTACIKSKLHPADADSSSDLTCLAQFWRRSWSTAALCVLAICLIPSIGCAPFRSPPLPLTNPVTIPVVDRDFTWDQIVDVVDDYFQIDREDRVRLEGDVLTAGRIDTFPQGGATLLEPFKRDSVGGYERLESTFQSIRRTALVQVEPVPEGFRVDVTVFKELEDVARPDYATAARAMLRNDTSNTREVDPVTGQPFTAGWIPQGRDAPLEQKILSDIVARAAIWSPGWQAPRCAVPGGAPHEHPAGGLPEVVLPGDSQPSVELLDEAPLAIEPDD